MPSEVEPLRKVAKNGQTCGVETRLQHVDVAASAAIPTRSLTVKVTKKPAPRRAGTDREIQALLPILRRLRERDPACFRALRRMLRSVDKNSTQSS